MQTEMGMCVSAQVSTQPDAEIFAPIRRCLSEYLLHPDAFLDTGEAVVAALRAAAAQLGVSAYLHRHRRSLRAIVFSCQCKRARSALRFYEKPRWKRKNRDGWYIWVDQKPRETEMEDKKPRWKHGFVFS